MKRRDFLARSGAASLAAAGVSNAALVASAEDAFRPGGSAWQTYEVTTTIRLVGEGTPARLWVPVPSFEESDWMRPGETTWKTDAVSAQLVQTAPANPKMLYAQWNAASGERGIRIQSVVTTRDLAIDLTRPQSLPALTPDEYRFYTSATELLPTDGIVGETSRKIVGSATSDLEKAKRLYDWIVVNASRNPKTRGCGLGNVAFMLQTGDLSGKCADINGLFVALARSAGLPARDLFGIRVAPSRFGYKTLGANSSVITTAQHCRAEVYLQQYGWVPVDPADVRKVMLEEPPGDLPAGNAKVVAAREALFGSWEGNYVAYNQAHDVTLPGSNGPDLGFLMYPQAEVAGIRKDSLSANGFVYAIESQRLS